MPKSRSKIKPIINKAEVARRLGLTRQYVGQLLNPKNKRKNPKRLSEISKLIHEELHELKRSRAA